MEHDMLQLPDGRRIAYRLSPGRGPGVVFLGGFRSDMTGTKAQFLEAWARAQGRGFLRFDYTGHGASSGEFRAGGIGDWAQDARDAILRLTEGPQVLVGSSMGGWIALLFARRTPARVAGLVGIAAAPDFTEDAMWAGLKNAPFHCLHRRAHRPPGAVELDGVGCDLDLARKREHVRREPGGTEYLGVDFPRLRVLRRLFEHRREIRHHADARLHAGVIHRYLHLRLRSDSPKNAGIMNERGLVWDNHACLPLRDIDAFLPSLSRYRNAGVDVVTVNIGDSLVPLETMIRTAASIRHYVKGNPDKYLLGLSPADLRAARASGRLAVCLDVEGVQALGPQLSLVEFLYEIGVDAARVQQAKPCRQRLSRHRGSRTHRARARIPSRNGSRRHGQMLLAHRLSHGA